LLDRQNFNTMEYTNKWEEMNGMLPLHHPTLEVHFEPYLQGKPIDPDPNEKGWKDTVRMNPGQVTRIRVRFAPQDLPNCVVKPGRNYYPFEPESGPGYVWHCHILDHEDNEMMRPYQVKP
ncbi:MAG: multicopper oxidase domain-containing protein, partial [Erysipelotrichaceae bacterium]